MKILVVDDDELLVSQLAADLLTQNYVVDTTTDGLLGWEYASASPYDLIVLDFNLPGLDGVSLCRRLRQQGHPGAILLLTSRSDSADLVAGLDAGADDYLIKPYTPTELAARLRALLRRPRQIQSLALGRGALHLDPSAGQVTYGDRPLPLSPKEFSLLELLLRHPDRIFSNTMLLERLWGIDETPGEETIRTHIKRLRRKLRQAGAEDPIENVYGMGYRLRPLSPGSEATAAAPPPGPEGAQAARAAAIAAFDRFRPAVDERMAALHRAAAALESGTLTADVQAQAQAAAHKLAGSLGLFGLGAGSHLARRLEDWLQQPNLAQAEEFLAGVAQLQAQLAGPPAIASPEPPLPIPRDCSPPGAGVQVLAIDDDPLVVAQLQGILGPWGLAVQGLHDPRQALAALAAHPPDLVLLDLDLPHLGGLELCEQLRQSDRWQTLPIIVVTACRDAATIYRLYQAGADDYLPKPILAPELIHRLFHRLERGRRLQRLAGLDPLTGLASRQRGTVQLELLLSLADRQRQSLAVVLVAIGPEPGPPQRRGLALALGKALAPLARQGDVVARWGDDEFLIGLWDSDRQTARHHLGRALRPLLSHGQSPAVTHPPLYLGAVGFPADGSTLAELYQRAVQTMAPLEASELEVIEAE